MIIFFGFRRHIILLLKDDEEKNILNSPPLEFGPKTNARTDPREPNDHNCRGRRTGRLVETFGWDPGTSRGT